MAGRTVDVVASGPPSDDPYDPAASAWALAQGLAQRGHSVQVVYPGPEAPAPAAHGLPTTAFPAVTAHVGTPKGDAEIAREASRYLRPSADAVVRDPVGLGSILAHAPRRRVVAFVHALEADGLAPGLPSEPKAAALPARLAGWGERRELRRLERTAVLEASTVCCANTTVRDHLASAYRVEAGRLQLLPPAVALGPEAPSRSSARRTLGVPDDVPLVAVLPDLEGPPTEAVQPSLQAFARLRQLFAGSRLVVLGAPGLAAPGVAGLPSRDVASIVSAFAAADLAVVLGRGAGPTAGLVLALRAGLACAVAPQVELGGETATAVRKVDLADPGELASFFAEFVSDPAERAQLGAAGRKAAERYAPTQLAEKLESAGALGGR